MNLQKNNSLRCCRLCSDDFESENSEFQAMKKIPILSKPSLIPLIRHVTVKLIRLHIRVSSSVNLKRIIFYKKRVTSDKKPLKLDYASRTFGTDEEVWIIIESKYSDLNQGRNWIILAEGFAVGDLALRSEDLDHLN